MSSEILEKLFGSAGRVKIIRLFLSNGGNVFAIKEIAQKTKVSPSLCRREIRLLEKISFIEKKSSTFQELLKLKNGRIKNAKKKIEGYSLNGSFPLIVGLKSLILNASPLSKLSVGRMARTAGKVKLFIIAGFLIQGEESRVDLLIAGDSLKKSSIERTVQAIEAEVGRDVTYAVMTTQEFKYRLDMCDKFVRDILDGPHEKVINKMGIV